MNAKGRIPALNRLEEFMGRIANLLPNWHEVYMEIEIFVANPSNKPSDDRQAQYLIDGLTSILEWIEKDFSKIIAVKLISCFVRTQLSGNDGPSARLIAEAYRQEKDIFVERAIAFYQQYPYFSFMDLAYLIYGIEKYGENDLVMGMEIAPRPNEKAEPPFTGTDEELNNLLWQRQKRNFATTTARMGFEWTKELVDSLLGNGFSQRTVSYMVNSISPFNFWPDAEIKRIVRRIFSTIKIALENGFLEHEWVFNIYHALEYHKGTAKEITDLLSLARHFQITSISAQNFNIALELWRRFSLCIYVYEAFRQNVPGSLAFAQAGIKIASTGIGAESSEERQLVLDQVAYEADLDAAIATLKALRKHHDEMGLTLEERRQIADIQFPEKMVSEIATYLTGNIAMLGTGESGQPRQITHKKPLTPEVIAKERELYNRLYRIMRRRIDTGYV